MSGVTLNTQGLQSLKRKLKTAEKARAEVGLFTSHDARDDGESNIAIGRQHEFGQGVPRRSFLEIPMLTEFPKIVEGESESLAETFANDGAAATLERLGFMGEVAIQEAFDTGGFGQWPANSPHTLLFKKGDKPLIDTSQLRGAISSRVK